ncbi:ABC transporter permease [Microbacterium betulae]|uniref:ABC transporter permease n=1 Tax=Microbacterium betulae TaxID=2981139 RepID=A0AA97I516_9MICO|nr:ABC transporter permease [Microbacterium sp. AB]WOF22349.1 ABC transporter permease [Microbacterium sp. AB]
MTAAADLARRALRRPGLLLAIAVVVIVAGWAIAPGLFAPGDPLRAVPEDRLGAPSAAHLFGTDELGRDLFIRVVHGASLSIRSTLLAVVIALVAGSLVGILAGYLGGVVDGVLMRAIDVVLAIPGLLLSLAVIAALGAGSLQISIAVGVGSLPSFARVVRSETMRVRSSDFVETCRALGVRGPRMLVRHVLPNVLGPVVVLAVATLATAVLAVSALSFLGFGTPPPAPEWGNLISEGRDYLASAWWLTMLPAAVVVAVVLSVNHLSRSLSRESGRSA